MLIMRGLEHVSVRGRNLIGRSDDTLASSFAFLVFLEQMPWSLLKAEDHHPGLFMTGKATLHDQQVEGSNGGVAPANGI